MCTRMCVYVYIYIYTYVGHVEGAVVVRQVRTPSPGESGVGAEHRLIWRGSCSGIRR